MAPTNETKSTQDTNMAAKSQCSKTAQAAGYVSRAEERIAKRIREVDRLYTRISNELRKPNPCHGKVPLELMQLELAELKRDQWVLREKYRCLRGDTTGEFRK